VNQQNKMDIFLLFAVVFLKNSVIAADSVGSLLLFLCKPQGFMW
jgi:hypothetical protein